MITKDTGLGRRAYLKYGGIAVGSALAGCLSSGDGGGSGGQTTRSSGSEQIAKKITYYGSGLHKRLWEGFTEETGIEVDINVLKGRGPIKYLNEAKAGEKIADVIQTQSQISLMYDHPEEEGDENWLQEVEDEHIPNPDKIWYGQFKERFIKDFGEKGMNYIFPYNLHYKAFPYNTNNIDKPPKTHEELLEPRFKNQLVSPPYSMPANLQFYTQFFGDKKKAEDFIVKLGKQGISYVPGYSANAKAIIEKDVNIALNLSAATAGQFIKKGAPIDISMPPAVNCGVGLMSVASEAPHPKAAKRFIEYLLKPDKGQKMMQEDYDGLGGHPIHKDLKHGNEAVRKIIKETDPEPYPIYQNYQDVEYYTQRTEELIGVS